MISDFAKEKVFWTKKMNLKLVKFIQSRPNIWNPKHPKYTSVQCRDHTYAEFAEKYGNEFTGQAVKDRWKNIRSTFANYVRKIKASQAKNGEKYKVNWHLWEACQFLKKVNRAVKLNTDEFNAENKQENFELEGKDLLQQKGLDYNSDQYSENNSNISCRGIAENLVTILKSVQNDSFVLDNNKYGEVGRAVTKKLNEINSLEAAKMIQQIVEILCLYDRNNLLNPNYLKINIINE